MISKKILFFCLTFVLCFSTNGQSEAEILDQANTFFKNRKFVEATPLYLRLLSLQPKNIDYNYRYGTCLLFNSNKKQESLRFLIFATESEQVNPEAYFYMGRAYHLNYLFNDAVRSYDKYTSLVGESEAVEQNVTQLIQMCQEGRRLLLNYSEMVVYDKKEIEADKFFRLYDLKDIGGNLLVTAEFQSKTDKKEGHTPLIYFPKNATEIYYSSYGETGENGKEIYRRLRKPSGGWGEPELIKGIVNTKYDEDFAYRSQDGNYLYFSSKGHNSMGGYDVFRSIYDKTTDSFIETENMDFAISSPDDDIFFLVDQNNQNGYFASARQSETGKLFVYKIRVEKLPTQLSIIAGVLESKLTKNTKISVEVQDLSNDQIIGSFKSKEDGKILITFPGGGQYKYRMKIEGDTALYTQNVNIPLKKSIKPLRQNLVHFIENGKEVIRVLDRFDEAVLEKDDILAALFSDKAQLNPNAQFFDLEKLEIISQQKKILAEIAAPNLTISEVASELAANSKSIKEVEDQAIFYEQKTTILLEKAMSNLQEIDKKIAKNASEYRTSEENSMTRNDLLLESKKLLSQREELTDKIEDYLSINQKVQENLVFYKDLKIRASDWETKSNEIKKLMEQDKTAEALQYIKQNQVVIKSGMTNHIDSYQTKTTKEVNDYNLEITELGRKKYNYETSAKDLQNNIDYLERKIFEGNAKDKELTKENIALKKTDLNLIKEEISTIGSQIVEKRSIKENLADELAEFMSVENTADPKTILSYENAKVKWNQLKNSPMTSDYLLLAQEVEKNENVDISSNTLSTENEVKTLGEIYQEVNPYYLGNINAIISNSKSSDSKKAELLLIEEKANQLAIQTAINSNKLVLEKNATNDIALKNLENLHKILEASKINLANYTKLLVEEKSKTFALEMTEATIVMSIDKTYEEIWNYLNEDVVSDQLTKLQSLNEHDKAFLIKVANRLIEVEKSLKLETNQKALWNKEKELLSNLNSKKQTEITSRNSLIADIYNQLALNSENSSENDTVTESKIDTANSSSSTKNESVNAPDKVKFSELSFLEQEFSMLNAFSNDFTLQKDQIENSSISDSKKIEALLALNNDLLKDIKTEKKRLNKKTQFDELATLNRLEEKTKQDSKQIELNILTISEEPESLISRLDANYHTKLKEVEQNLTFSPIQKVEQQIAINANLVDALRIEKAKFEKFALANPDNLQLMDKIESIDQIQSEYAQVLTAHKDRLVSLNSEITANEKVELAGTQKSDYENLKPGEQENLLLEKVDSKYTIERQNIEKETTDERQKINRLIALDNALLNSLDVEKENNANANDYNQIDAIKRLILKTNASLILHQNKINELEAIALSNSKESTNESFFSKLTPLEQEEKILNTVSSTYKDEETAIEKSQLTDIEKNKKRIELRNTLIENLKAEKQKNNAFSNQEENATLDRLLNKTNKQIALLKNDLSVLEVSEKEKNALLEATENSFNKLTIEQQERTVLTEFSPNYNIDKEAIENGEKNEKIKLKKLLTLDENLVAVLANEKEKLDSEKDFDKIETIKRIENSLNDRISDNQLSQLASIESANEFVSRIAKDYLINKEQLKNNPNLSEVEKAKRQIAIDQLLLESFEKEKEKFVSLSIANPLNETLKIKEIFIFDQIAAKQKEISLLSALLKSDVTQTIPVSETNGLTTNKGANSENSEKAKLISSTADLRNKLLGNLKISLMDSSLNAANLEDLKSQYKEIEQYENGLNELESEWSTSEKATTSQGQLQLNIISEEIKEVAAKKRQYSITIGELELELLATKEKANSKSDQTIERISNEEKELLEKLEGDITSMSDIRKIEKQLIKLADQKVERKNELLTLDTKNMSSDNNDKLQVLKEIPTSSVAERLSKEFAVKRSEQIEQEVNVLRELAQNTKNREAANELMVKIHAKEKQVAEILEIALVDGKVAQLTEGKISTISTKEELLQRKNLLEQEESNYNSEIKNIVEEIKNADNPKVEQVLIAKRATMTEERLMILDQMAFIDKKIAQLPSQPKATIPAESKETELSYQDEVEISSSYEFIEISKATKTALFLENEISFLLKSIDKDKQEAHNLIELAAVEGSKKDNQKAEDIVKEIQNKEQRLMDLKKELVSKQAEIADLFPIDKIKKAKIENLLLRGIEPMRTEISNYIAIPEKGFEVETSAKNVKNKELIVENNMPSGLMFRVQVGAFSKPVAKDAFQEFNPVTGEKRDNGLTVYMAGYFGQSTGAADAQKTIRSMGYVDAFVVAYCDGQRIPLVEGRRLEATKTCTPFQIQNSAIQRLSVPKDTTKIVTRELDYNKALGAAPAFPVELKKGLFYTVQIGVYNKPVDPSTIKNITPLITKRLPNGQIRYSAGVYVSIEDAMPKRKEAIDKGISDAFITAYYGSERISLTDAEKLLQDHGIGIIEKTALGIVKDVKQRIVAEEKLKEAIVAVEKQRFEEGMGIQLVSKESFNEFPRDMLNRFNKHVSFYFDQNDKRLKSNIFTKVEDIPQIHFLRDDVDTIFISDFKKALNQEKDGYRKIVFFTKNGQLPGDLADFLYRLNYRKEYFEMGESMKVTLHNIPSNSIQFISDELRNLKIWSEVE